MKIETGKTWADRPRNTQFVAVWEYDGGLWSAAFSKVNGVLLEYDNQEDDWVAPQTPDLVENITFITK